MTTRWIDCSNHNPITQDILEEAREKGVTGVVFNLLNIYPLGITQQLDLAQSSGFRLAGYVYLNFPGGEYYGGNNGYNQVYNQLYLLKQYPIEWVALDCEDPGNTLPQQATIAFISSSESACKDLQRPSRIYTGYNWWKENTGDSRAFCELDLWNATDDKVPDLNYAGYGGWGYPTMEQYDFNGRLGAYEYDFNIVKEDELRTLPLDQSETIALFRGIVANVTSILTDTEATAELVVEGYSDHPERDTYIIQIPKGTGRG